VFLGHIAVGFAGKRVAPRTSLGWLMTAPVLADLLWPVFLILGIERVRIVPGATSFTPLDFESYPWSHSLLMSVAWGLALALLARAFKVDARGGLVIVAGVVSHWVLDWISHRPDMPLQPWGGPRVGLGLWNSVPATVAVEAAMMIAGLWLSFATTRARSLAGHLSLWSFVALLVVAYVGSSFGPPPSVEALRVVGLVTWLFVPWAFWIDRSRVLRAAPA
jgi:hypothetical protein